MAMQAPPHLTERARRAFALAHGVADRRGDAALTTTHLALGLLEEGEGVPTYILRARGVLLDAVARELEAELPVPGAPHSPPSTRPWTRPWTSEDEALVEQATVEARTLDTVYCSCEHLLLVLLRDPAGAPARVLARHGVGYEDARAAVRWVHDGQQEVPPPWQAAG